MSMQTPDNPFALQADPFATGDDPFAEPLPDLFASIDYTGDVEVDSAAEAETMRTAFGQRARNEAKRVKAATDSEYWACLCFQSREQKEAFLAAMSWLVYGDKYLDGTALARLQGITLPEARVPFVEAKPDRSLSDLSLPLPGAES